MELYQLSYTPAIGRQRICCRATKSWSNNCAVALDLCLVAAGVLDGSVDCVDEAHGVWDYLASVLICREAGVVVADLHGRDLAVLDHTARRTPIAGATVQLFDQLLAARQQIR